MNPEQTEHFNRAVNAWREWKHAREHQADEVARLVDEAIDNGVKASDIADALGINRSNVTKIRKRNN